MMKRIPLSEIYGNPNQPRKIFDQGELESLAASIVENGLKQPITVRPDEDGRYMIVMGERRFRAHQVASLPDILCHISKVADDQLAIDAIIENDQRVDVTPLEQARSYQRMIDVHGFDVDKLAKKLGKLARRITDRLNLLNLNDDALFLLERDQITPLQASWLCELDHRNQTLLLKAINAGHCNTIAQLRETCAALKSESAQDALFAMPLDEPTDEQRKQARSFEDRIEAVSALLRASVLDNEIVALKRVNRDKLSTAADLFAAMALDIRRIENALRVQLAGAAMQEA
jgi:ParB family chromosome partitioning protein